MIRQYRKERSFGFCATLIAIACATPGMAQEASGAQEAGSRAPRVSAALVPPAKVAAMMSAPPAAELLPGPDGVVGLLYQREAATAAVWTPGSRLRIAGLELDPRNGARTQAARIQSVSLLRLSGGDPIPVAVPEPARVRALDWSHNGSRFAFTREGDAGIELWIVLVTRPEAPQLVTSRLNAGIDRGFHWLADGDRMLLTLVPKDRGAPPTGSADPNSARVVESSVHGGQLDALWAPGQGGLEAQLFEHYATSQLALWNPESSSLTEIGEPGIYTELQPAPSRDLFLTTRLVEPLGAAGDWTHWPRQVEIRGPKGQLLTTLAERNGPAPGAKGYAPTGPRNIGWGAGNEANAIWLEALDGGDPRREVPERDRLMTLDFPFEGEARELLRTRGRATGVLFTRNPERVLVREYDPGRGRVSTHMHGIGAEEFEARLLDDTAEHDAYADPGRILTSRSTSGIVIARHDKHWIYRAGEGHSKRGAQPFLARQNLLTGEVEPIWQCAPGSYERVLDLLVSGTERRPEVLTVYESPLEPPVFRRRNLERPQERLDLYRNQNRMRELRGLGRRSLSFESSSGQRHYAELYTPSGFDADRDGPLPLLIWLDEKALFDPSENSQRLEWPHRFLQFEADSPVYLTSKGVAVLAANPMPLGDLSPAGLRTWEAEFESALRSAVNAVLELGLADPDRLAVGGRNHGAFLAAHALARTDLFRAGVAIQEAGRRALRSGSEPAWRNPLHFGDRGEFELFASIEDAAALYLAFPPSAEAGQLQAPLLLIEGRGSWPEYVTPPLLTGRLYRAIELGGGHARRVILAADNGSEPGPNPALHAMGEMFAWLDRYLLSAPAPVEAASSNSMGDDQ